MRTLVLTLTLAVALLLVASASQAAPGALDPTFGKGGTVMTRLRHTDTFGNAVAEQRDGKIVVAGGAAPWLSLVRYTRKGKLDRTFGSRGSVITEPGGQAFSLAIQPDGKLVVAGVLQSGAGVSMLLMRFNPDGSLDSTFGPGGVVTGTLGHDLAVGESLALQPDGKLVVGLLTATASTLEYHGVVARFTSNGHLDSSFGSSGVVRADFWKDSSLVSAVAVQPNGRIVVGGWSFVVLFGGQRLELNGFALARLTSNGALDPTFGSGGATLTDVGGGGALNSLALQPDGKILAAGSTLATSTGYASAQNLALARFGPEGKLDPSFGSGGTVVTQIGKNSEATSVLALPGGKALAVDYRLGRPAFSLVRYRANGSRDPKFGRHGEVLTTFGRKTIAYANSALVQNRKVVVAGTRWSRKGNGSVAVARYLAK